MPLKEQLTEAMKNAMRAREKERLGAIRLILAEIKRVEVDERIEVADERVLAILDKMSKQRKDSITQFDAARREDLSAKERAELVVIQEFLPQALSPEEISSLIKNTLEELNAEGMKDMGKVMNALRPQLQGRADLGKVSQEIKALLQS